VARTIKPEDIEKIYSLSEPSFSPDGRYIAFSAKKPDIRDDIYYSDIWLADLKENETRKFTTGRKDYNPKFSNDGKKILFLSKRGFQKDEKGNSLYVISCEGGEATELLRREEQITKAEWSPDSSKIYFISSVTKKEKDDVKIIKRAYFWFNGEGFTYNKRKHLFCFDIKKGETEQITRGDFDVKDFSVSSDGKIAYTASKIELKPYITDLFVIDKKGKTRKITKSNMEVTSITWNESSDSIAFLGDDFPRGFASHEVIWISRKMGQPYKIDRIDRNKANTLNSDVRSEAHGSNKILWKSGFIYYLKAEGGSCILCRTRVKGEEEVIVGGERSVEGYDVSQNSTCFVSMNSYEPEELFLLENGIERKITSFNSSITKELGFIKHDHFSFKASDGETVEGWVISRKKDTKVPTILYIHGGPKTSFGNSFIFEFQLFASNGYAVVYTNPRGSDGYSEEFADIRGKYGKRDYMDLMEAFDFALSKFDFLDGSRACVAGGSYGGFMTNWIIGHTDRFKAAVTDRSISSWLSMWGTSDIGPYFTEDQIAADPFENWAKLIQDSPLLYAKNVKTPLLIVHSFEDYRCWQGEAYQLYTALKQLGKDVEMVLFPGENHDLSRTGKPKHRVTRLNSYLRWFSKYL
jgi:dipeptidyl aminopeptidase/acylaminoacyl peptidase